MTNPLHGFKRVPIAKDPAQQLEMDALFTIGRLAREGKLKLYTYTELNVEQWRGGRGKMPFINAFRRCQAETIPTPLERSKWRQTIDTEVYFAKGGAKAKTEQFRSSEMTQVAFFKFLCELTESSARAFENVNDKLADQLRLSNFEVQSLRDLPWFKTLATALGYPISDTNLPDAFHIFAAKRSGLSSFLTLEKRLVNGCADLAKRRVKHFNLDVSVCRPSLLLAQLGISELDEVPVQPDRFYTYAEVFDLDHRYFG